MHICKARRISRARLNVQPGFLASALSVLALRKLRPLIAGLSSAGIVSNRGIRDTWKAIIMLLSNQFRYHHKATSLMTSELANVRSAKAISAAGNHELPTPRPTPKASHSDRLENAHQTMASCETSNCGGRISSLSLISICHDGIRQSFCR